MSGFGDIVFGSTRAMSDDEDEEFEQIQEYFIFLVISFRLISSRTQQFQTH